MTVASEISRLQCAKADIKAAIEEKGIEVGSDMTLDNYASCIDAIQTGGGLRIFSYLAVGGGGSGGTGGTGACSGGGCGACAGGGGGGEIGEGILLADQDNYCILIGAGGAGPGGTGRDEWGKKGCDGCPSEIYGCICVRGGKGGEAPLSSSCRVNNGGASGSGMAGGESRVLSVGNIFGPGGGGGGAKGAGCTGSGDSFYSSRGGNGGCGYRGMGGGGGGSGGCYGGSGCDGGGNGGCCGDCWSQKNNAKYYGGGGGGGQVIMGYGVSGGSGYQGVIDICYPSDGSYGINSATGGNCCYICDGFCVHRFTSDGTFCIVS